VHTTQQFFKDLMENGYIEEKVTDQLYSEQDHKFLADRYVVGTCPNCGYDQARGDECQRCGASYEATELEKPRSKISGAPLIYKKTKHWFLRFELFKERLAEWIEKKDWKANVVNFARHYIDDLHARAITRDSAWGIPVPLKEAQGKVFYVWFDAPIGYISATQDWAQTRGTPEAWKNYWCDPQVKLVQFIGKDNIPFHAVFFPSMCMGQNQPYKLVDELPANEFYNLEGRQFSKSDGWYIDLDTFFEQFTPDQIRYTIASNAPESQDSEFTWKDFQSRCNSELLGKYGNLVNRVLVFAANHCSAKIPTRQALSEIDQQFLAEINQLADEAAAAFEKFHLRRASQIMMQIAQTGNVYFDGKQPWKTAKNPETRPEMENTIYCCLECIKTLALVSSSIIPDTAEKVWHLLGFHSTLSTQNWDRILQEHLKPGTPLPKPEILFKRIEDDVIEAEIDKLKRLGSKKENQPKVVAEKKLASIKSEINIDDVRKLDLRVGQILSVERVPKSKKLLKLQVDIGLETRQIVSGIGEAFSDLDTLKGKKVIIVANLKAALLMSIESQGMLLTAETTNGLELPSLIDAPNGSQIS
jgi:methionyl-tRNA synthetase